MDNKLSELSKPVGFVSELASTQLKEGDPASIRPFFDVQGSSPLYSQEYVSALLAELEAKDKRITTVTEEREFWRERVEGAEKEREEFRRRFKLERSCLEDADKRITALDMRNAELNSTIERWATERAESASRIDELEAKLATPVRLPEKFSMLHRTDFHEDYHSTMAFKSVEVFDAIRAAGFTFTVGDE